MVHDAHCHLGFMTNANEVAAEARERGMLLFANGVAPELWREERAQFAALANVTVGFGMHPWWANVSNGSDGGAPAAQLTKDAQRQAASQRAEHRRLADEAERGDTWTEADQQAAAERRATVLRLLDEDDPAFIGEVGLDFSWRHVAGKRAQLDLFGTISSWCANHGDKVISLHSVKAARETLDVLQEAGALSNCACVFHWFSGSGDQLKRAIEAECFFSCGPRMLATGKGREYVKAIPAERILLETDAPPQQGMPYSYKELRATLEDAASAIAALKGVKTLETIAQTHKRLFAQR